MKQIKSCCYWVLALTLYCVNIIPSAFLIAVSASFLWEMHMQDSVITLRFTNYKLVDPSATIALAVIGIVALCNYVCYFSGDSLTKKV